MSGEGEGAPGHLSDGSDLVMSAADYKRWLQTLRQGDLVDMSDVNQTTWTTGRVYDVAPDAIHCGPLTPQQQVRTDWILKSSGRVAKPHTHHQTNKNIKPPASAALPQAGSRPTSAAGAGANQQAVNAAAAGLASLAVPNGGAGKPAGSPAGSPLLPLPAVPASAGNSPNPGASPRNPPAALPPAAAGAGAAAAKPAASASSAPAAAAAPVISEAELKKFRAELKVGDLVDFESHLHRSSRSNVGLWYLGEVSRIDNKFMPFSTPDVFVHNHTKGDIEFMSRDSARLWPPMTKTVQQQAAQAAAAQQALQQPPPQRGPEPQQNLAQPVARQGQLPPVQGRPGNVAGNAALAASNPVPVASPQPGQASQPAAAEGAPGGAPGGAPVAGAVAGGAAASPTPAAAAGQAPPESVPPPVENFGYQLRKGDVADCLDTEQKWRLIEVIATDPTHVLVHYVDWSSKWDEWIPKTDPRIQPPRTRTEGYTGPANKKPVVPVFKPPPPPPAPVAPPRPSYSCLAACSWHRVLSSGLSHKEITALNDLFASCCYVQDTYQEVLLGTQQTPVHNNSHSSAYSSYWNSPPPPPVYKHTLASVTELLTKLEKDIETQTAALPSSCAFMLSQASTIAVNIRGLILDSEETTRRQLLLQQEDLYMQRLKEQFRIVEVPSDGSCLFSAVGMGQQLRQAALGSDASKLASSASPKKPSGAAAEDDGAVAMSDVHVSVPSSDESKSGESEDAKPACADPALVLQLLHDSGDSHLQQIVAAKCRAQLVSYLRAHTAAVASPSASSSASASPSSDSSQQWLDRIKSEVKEVLQQESAGKYSDATSKAVWEELSSAAKAAAAAQQAGGAAAAANMGSASAAAPTPLSLADTPAAVEAYIKVMSQEGIYGTGVEVEALSEMMRAPIHVYYRSAEAPPVAAAPGEVAASMPPERIVGEQFSGPPISLAYYMGQKHYNLLVDRKAIPPPPAKQAPPSASASHGASSSSTSASPPAPAVASAPHGEPEGKVAEQPGVVDASASAPGEPEGSPAGADSVPTIVVPADQPMLQVQEPEMAPFTSVVPEPSAPAAAAPAAKPTASAMAAAAAAKREEKRVSGGGASAAAGASAPHAAAAGSASPQFTIQTPVTSSYPFVPAAGAAGGAGAGSAATAHGARPAPVVRTSSGGAGSGGGSAPGSAAPSPSHHHGHTHAAGLAAGAPGAAGGVAGVPRASAPPASVAGIAAAAPHGSRPASAASSPVVSALPASGPAGHPNRPPPSYSASVSSHPVSASSAAAAPHSNVLHLLVHFPGLDPLSPVPTGVYRDQQLVSLVNHPAIPAMPAQEKLNIKFFVSVGTDWEEVDARKTPDQLKLKENSRIGIRLPH